MNFISERFLILLTLIGSCVLCSVDAGILDTPTPLIVAGDLTGTPSDSPSNRVDPNVSSSPYAGVGSIRISVPGTGTYISTGTLISPRHVLSAGHSFDPVGADGVSDAAPGNVTFYLNADGNYSHSITASQIYIHDDYTGFNNPSINDDIAIIELSQDITDVAYYELYQGSFSQGDEITMVGYGQSGDGVNGFTVSPSFTTKRSGKNEVDGVLLDDDGFAGVEVFYFDFDDPDGNINTLGGLSLGNDVEATIGGGDSGGPSFIDDNGQLKVFGVNTFGSNFNGGPLAPHFGSIGGGMVVPRYYDWIDSIVDFDSFAAGSSPVPEPSTYALLLLGIIGLVVYKKR